jgi:hypothetical protein
MAKIDAAPILSRSERTEAEILDRLAVHSDWRIRFNVAQLRSNITEAVLAKLSRDQDYRIRMAVAENPVTSVALLSELALDEHAMVRSAVAKHPATPVRTLHDLTNDDTYVVHSKASENPKFKQLMEHGLLDVARLASKWLKIL